jgi:hypothetical protein
VRFIFGLSLFFLFLVPAVSSEIHLKSGKLIYADDLPWVDDDKLCFHIEGQLSAVRLATVDLQKTRTRDQKSQAGGTPEYQGQITVSLDPNQTSGEEIIEAKRKIQELQRLSYEYKLAQTKTPFQPDAPQKEETSTHASIPLSDIVWPEKEEIPPELQWLHEEPPSQQDRADELKRRLDSNLRMLQMAPERHGYRRAPTMPGRQPGGSGCDWEALQADRERLLLERADMVQRYNDLTGESMPMPDFDPPKPPEQPPLSEVSADSSYEIPTATTGGVIVRR